MFVKNDCNNENKASKYQFDQPLSCKRDESHVNAVIVSCPIALLEKLL